MWYWTRFLLQMLTRACLATAVLVWIVGQWGPASFMLHDGSVKILGLNRARAVAVEWRSGTGATYYRYPVMPWSARNTNVNIPGVAVWGSFRNGAAQIDHWLICLSLLILTVITRAGSGPRETNQSAESDE